MAAVALPFAWGAGDGGLEELQRRCQSLMAEVQAQAAASLKAQDSARKHRVEIEGLESEIRSAERVTGEHGKAFEESTIKLAEVRAATAALEREKRLLCRRIPQAQLEVCEVEAEVAQVSDTASTSVTRVTYTEHRTQCLKRAIFSLGDTNAAFAEKAAAERERLQRAREVVRSELQRLDAEREELHLIIAEHSEDLASVQAAVAASGEKERALSSQGAILKAKIAEFRHLSPRLLQDRQDLIGKIREATATDAGLREELHAAQERLWQRQRGERES
mmetsp:Transcript_71762/g.181326  ORF Transcript_71762/g.181326 Transcript_71762/m.181326 type:complete len:277 (+) Transcript_71762:165-995(+)|eukprot:CAMPEP_0183428008 /NCGR_PEP_ID=MMETSP0370-20130417/44143_1 /TAXON_ID=268820 /ORGANISM="Peridinium aciculiferum, Strain PAER-2" /LENGTH=276 /DNA_ID=CAMNT_0025612707 /DNA_START=156 /DNA_END=986 /DNA_ORIENTATION=-